MSKLIAVVIVAATVPVTGLVAAWLVSAIGFQASRSTASDVARPWGVWLPASMWGFGKTCLA